MEITPKNTKKSNKEKIERKNTSWSLPDRKMQNWSKNSNKKGGESLEILKKSEKIYQANLTKSKKCKKVKEREKREEEEK